MVIKSDEMKFIVEKAAGIKAGMELSGKINKDISKDTMCVWLFADQHIILKLMIIYRSKRPCIK